MSQSCESDQLRIILETDHPETEAVFFEAVDAALHNRGHSLSRDNLIVPQKLPHARISPETMQYVNVVRCKWAQRQPLCFDPGKTHNHKTKGAESNWSKSFQITLRPQCSAEYR